MMAWYEVMVQYGFGKGGGLNIKLLFLVIKLGYCLYV